MPEDARAHHVVRTSPALSPLRRSPRYVPHAATGFELLADLQKVEQESTQSMHETSIALKTLGLSWTFRTLHLCELVSGYSLPSFREPFVRQRPASTYRPLHASLDLCCNICTPFVKILTGASPLRPMLFSLQPEPELPKTIHSASAKSTKKVHRSYAHTFSLISGSVKAPRRS